MIGHKQPASSRIAHQVAWLAAQTGLTTQRRQIASWPLNSQRGSRATRAIGALADREQESALRIERQKRGVDLRGGVQERELPTVRVLLEDLNTFRSARTCVGSNVDELRWRCALGGWHPHRLPARAGGSMIVTPSRSRSTSDRR